MIYTTNKRLYKKNIKYIRVTSSIKKFLNIIIKKQLFHILILKTK